jgi:hypothetical protein
VLVAFDDVLGDRELDAGFGEESPAGIWRKSSILRGFAGLRP